MSTEASPHPSSPIATDMLVEERENSLRSRKACRRSPNLHGIPKEKAPKLCESDASARAKPKDLVGSSTPTTNVNGKDPHETVQFSARLTARIRMAELQKASCECGKCELPQHWLPADLRVHLHAMTNAKLQAKKQKEQDILRASDPDLEGVNVVQTKYAPQVKTTTSRFPLLCDPLAALFGGLGAVSSQFDHTHFLYRRMASQFKRERLQGKKHVLEQRTADITSAEGSGTHGGSASTQVDIDYANAVAGAIEASTVPNNAFSSSSSAQGESSMAAEMALLLYAYERESRHLAHLRAGTPYITTRARSFDDLCTKWCADVQTAWAAATSRGDVMPVEGMVVVNTVERETLTPSLWRAVGAPMQVVLLGGGFDTRAYRLPSLREAAVFEVDQRDVIAFKEDLLPVRYGDPDTGVDMNHVAPVGSCTCPERMTEAGEHAMETGQPIACATCFSGCSVSHALLTPNPNNSNIFSEASSRSSLSTASHEKEAQVWPPRVISYALARVVGDIGTRGDTSSAKLMVRIATDEHTHTCALWVHVGEGGREIALTPNVPYGTAEYFRQLRDLHEQHINDYVAWKATLSSSTSSSSFSTSVAPTKSPVYPFPTPDRYSWLTALLRSGWTPQKPSLWLVEGVLMYLTRAQAEEVMSVLAQLAVSHTSSTKVTLVAHTEKQNDEDYSKTFGYCQVALSEAWCPAALSQLVFDCYSSHAAPSGTAYYSLFRYGFERQEAPYTLLSNGWAKMKMAVFGRKGWESAQPYQPNSSQTAQCVCGEGTRDTSSIVSSPSHSTRYDLSPSPSSSFADYTFARYTRSCCSLLAGLATDHAQTSRNYVPLPRVAHVPPLPSLHSNTTTGKISAPEIRLFPSSETRLSGILTPADTESVLSQCVSTSCPFVSAPQLSLRPPSSWAHTHNSADIVSSTTSVPVDPYLHHTSSLSSYSIPPLPRCSAQPLPLCFYPDARTFVFAPLIPTRNFPIGWADDTLESFVAQCARERTRESMRKQKDQLGRGLNDMYAMKGPDVAKITKEESGQILHGVGSRDHDKAPKSLYWTLQTLCNQMKVNDIAKLYSTFPSCDEECPPLYPLHYDRFLPAEAESEGGVLLVHHTKCARNKKANKKHFYDFDQAARDMMREATRGDDEGEDYTSICKTIEVECTCDPKLSRVECFLVVAGSKFAK